MKNLIPALRQTFIISKKPGFLAEKLKTLRSSKCLQKRVWEFFILFRSWVINKSVKHDCVETRSFLIFANTQDLTEIKKIPHPFVDIDKSETCVKFQQKILNCRIVGACQSFQIFRQNTWFLENNELCLNFCVAFCITWLALSNYIKITP